MICPKCKELGKKSIVYVGASFSTCAYYTPYYDEEGVYHYHDGNNQSSTYTCSEGHHITVCGTGKCPSCNYGNDKETVTVKDIPSGTWTIDGHGTIGGVVKLKND